MNWWQESKTRIFFDMHMPDWADRQTATAFNPEALADKFESIGADSVIVFAKCQYGNAYYPSALGPVHRGLNGLDFSGQLTALLKERGIRVILYYSVSWDEAYSEAHPECLVQGPDGETENNGFRWRTLCLNSAYRTYALKQLAEIARQLKPDGFWIDMTIIGINRCFCPLCRTAFEKACGYALPNAPEGKTLSDFKAFRYHVVEGFYSECQTLLRGILPNVCLTANYWGYPYSGWGMGSRILEATCGFDYVTGEAYTDWTGLMAPGLFTRYLRGVGNGRPQEVLLSRFLITWDFTLKTQAQLFSEMFTVAALGGCPTIDDQPFYNGQIDEEVYDDISLGFHEINRRKKTLSGEPLRYAAILVSQESKDAAIGGDTAYTQSFSGAYSLLQRMGVPTDFCFDHRLDEDELAQYNVILAPSIAVCGRSQWEALYRYMEKGGTVIAAGAFAMFTQGSGGLDPASFLADIGINDVHMSEGTLSYLKTDEALLLMHNPFVVYPALEGSEACIVDPICDPCGTRFFHNNLPSPYMETAHPGILIRPIGKGQLILYAQDVFSEYAGYASYKVYNLVEKTLLRHAAPPRVRLNGNGNRIELSALNVDGKLIIHLINFTPSRTVCIGHMETMRGQYQRTIEHMEEAAPVHTLSLTLVGTHIIAIEALAKDGAISFTNTKTGAEISLSCLTQWETLCITTKEA